MKTVYHFILKFFVGAIFGGIMGMFLGGIAVILVTWMGYPQSVIGPMLIGFIVCAGLVNAIFGENVQ